MKETELPPKTPEADRPLPIAESSPGERKSLLARWRTSRVERSPASAPATPEAPARGPAQPEMAVLLLAGVFFATLGQTLLPKLDPRFRWQALSYTALGVVLFAIGVRGFTRGQLPRLIGRALAAAGRWLGIQPVQVILLGLSPLLSVGAWLAAGDGWLMRLPAFAVGSWILAIVLVFGASHQPGRPIWEPGWTRLEILALAAITLIAFLTRVVDLTDIPWLFTGDEGSAGLSAVDFIEGRQNNIFGVGWFSFPSLYFYIESLSIRALGQTVVAARLPSAVAGALTAAGLYAFARPAFGRGVALASSAYLATFPFHVHFSRTGLNNIWDSLTVVVVSAALWVAWERNHLTLFALAGITLGIGQYFYPTSRVLYGMILGFLFVALVFDRRRLRERLPGVVVLALASVTAVLPLVIFYILHPAEYAAPLARVSILGAWMDSAVQAHGGRLWPVLWDQIRSSALAFSSLDLRGHFNGAPMLLPAAAGLFLLGIALALVNLPTMQYFWLLIWIVAAIATGALSQSTPTSQRYLYASPAVSILVTLPIVASAQWLKNIWPRTRRWLAVVAAVCVAAVIAGDLNFYFRVYSPLGEFGDLNTEVATRVAEYLNEREPGIHVYFAGAPRMGYATHKTIPFLVPGDTGEDLLAPLTAPPAFSLSGPTTFIVLPERSTDLDYIRQRFPNGSLEVVNSRGGVPLFYGYDVPGP